ncbi:MAG: hypothetical protein ACOYMF_13175, partial [Bacteroidales bacterium]
FHLMVYVKPPPAIDGVTLKPGSKSGCDIQSGRDLKSHPDWVESGHDLKSHPDYSRNQHLAFNKSIGIMLASYTRAINNQENRTGSLFRKETKAICLTQISRIAPSWFKSAGITYINNSLSEKTYPQVCFRYIHHNPVNAGLVKTPGEWEFSSYADSVGMRKGRLINYMRIKEFGLILPG